jgi:Zn-dependent protease
VSLAFDGKELFDLVVAWLALGLAFTLFIERSLVQGLQTDPTTIQLGSLAGVFGLSLATVGVGFLLHELAHKVVAVRFGQVANFRADYGMLFLAIMGGVVGFLFAAPGAVYHRGRISVRENGLIAAAGPITNLVLAGAFLAIGVLGVREGMGFVSRLGSFGLTINLLLAGFNMIPWGPLDGRKVLDWGIVPYLAVAVPSVGLAALVFLGGVSNPL